MGAKQAKTFPVRSVAKLDTVLFNTQSSKSEAPTPRGQRSPHQFHIRKTSTRTLAQVFPNSPRKQGKEVGVVTSPQALEVNVRQVRQRPSLPDVCLMPPISPKKGLPASAKHQLKKEQTTPKFAGATRMLLKKHLKEQQPPQTKIEFEEMGSPSAFYKSAQQFKPKNKSSRTENTYKLIIPRPAVTHVATKSDTTIAMSGVVSLLKEAATIKYEVQPRSNARHVNDLFPGLRTSGESSPMPSPTAGFTAAAEKQQTGYRLRSLLSPPSSNEAQTTTPLRRVEGKVRLWKGRLGTILAK